MKKNTLLHLISTLTQTEKGETKNLSFTKNIATEKKLEDKDVFSKYIYKDSLGKNVIIQNGYPKGGTKYIDPKGNECGYAVFWTRIINETDNTLNLDIDIPLKSYEISNVPGKYFKILVSTENMTIEKLPLNFYGLNEIENFLNKNIDRPMSLKRTIHPNESSGIYLLMLIMTKEATGMTRNEICLKGQDLIYKISRYSSKKPITLIDKFEIKCGSINLKKLTIEN